MLEKHQVATTYSDKIVALEQKQATKETINCSSQLKSDADFLVFTIGVGYGGKN